MDVFHHYMQGAAQAAIDEGTPLIDESLSMVLDSGFIFMIRYPQESADAARQAGAYRVTNATEYESRYGA